MSALIKTKTFWASMGMILIGVGTALQGQLQEGINLVVAGLMGIFLRDAIKKAEK